MADAALSALFDGAQPKSVTKICKICGGDIPSGKRLRSYCGPECAREGENSPRRTGAPLGSKIPCLDCGVEIIKSGPGRKRCEECVRIFANKKTLEMYRSKRSDIGIIAYGDEISCKDCGTRIEYKGGHHKRCADCQAHKRNNRRYIKSGREPNYEPLGKIVECRYCLKQFPRRTYNNQYCTDECLQASGYSGRPGAASARS
jgi:hypothetical protein